MSWMENDAAAGIGPVAGTEVAQLVAAPVEIEAPGATAGDGAERLALEIEFDGLTDRLANRAEALGERSMQWSGLQGSGGIEGGVDRIAAGEEAGPIIVETDEVPPMSFGDMMANFNAAYTHATEVSLVSAGLTGMSKSLNKLMSGS